MLAVISHRGLGHRYRVIAGVMMVVMITMVLIRPRLRPRNALPKPEIDNLRAVS